jgi:hypothetical protein
MSCGLVSGPGSGVCRLATCDTNCGRLVEIRRSSRRWLNGKELWQVEGFNERLADRGDELELEKLGGTGRRVGGHGCWMMAAEVGLEESARVAKAREIRTISGLELEHLSTNTYLPSLSLVGEHDGGDNLAEGEDRHFTQRATRRLLTYWFLQSRCRFCC